MTKKILSVLLTGLLLLSLAACATGNIQKSEEESEPSDTSKPEQKEPPVDPYADLPADVDDIRWEQYIMVSGWDDGWRTWKGWRINDDLLSFLTNPDEPDYAVVLVGLYDSDYTDTFEYNGMTDREAWNELNTSDSYHRCDELFKEMDQRKQAYHASFLAELKEAFADSGLLTRERNGYFFLVVRAEELANLEIENKEKYELTIASRYLYAGTVENIYSNVTGFNMEKLVFDFHDVDALYWEPTTGEDVVTAFHSLFRHWDVLEHSCTIQFTIHSKQPLTKEDLMYMNCKSIKQGSELTETIVTVTGDRLNLKALCDLTLREDITSIVIQS